MCIDFKFLELLNLTSLDSFSPLYYFVSYQAYKTSLSPLGGLFKYGHRKSFLYLQNDLHTFLQKLFFFV